LNLTSIETSFAAQISFTTIEPKTVFFWSEEHARDYRRKHQQPDGAYLTLSQAAFCERYAQSGLFAATLDGRLKR
jgi:hypothetical protein